MFNNRKSKGFTLIELLVVISIIGLLSSIVLVSLNQARAKARDGKRMIELRQIQTGLEMYYLDHDAYPFGGISYSKWDSKTWYLEDPKTHIIDPTTRIFYDSLVPKYLSSLPSDPKPSEDADANYLKGNSPDDLSFVYCPSPDGKAYILGTNLETGNRPMNQSICFGQTGWWGNYQIQGGTYSCDIKFCFK